MYIDCTDKELFILKKIAHAAEELGVPCYLIGGFVRDKILKRPTKDIDIVCVGDGIALAEKAAQKFNSRPEVHVFRNFGTAQIKFEDIEIEFVGARKESYNFDSRKPAVESGTLEDDQNRRDFTINALAISLNKPDYGTLIDPFDGIADLGRQIIQTPLAP
ncbi:MAG TPA: tRNA nucleotidyltransferase, partial [Ferruginibacter sp.]|nr:tRNA nucleotidyltransferase [Ferruginibacter sp.]